MPITTQVNLGGKRLDSVYLSHNINLANYLRNHSHGEATMISI